jgi:hypothetical protein
MQTNNIRCKIFTSRFDDPGFSFRLSASALGFGLRITFGDPIRFEIMFQIQKVGVREFHFI